MITDRAWNTIQAALRFWVEVCRTSPTPPWVHPKIQPFFLDDRPSPLTSDEIESIINSDPAAVHCYGYPVRVMADSVRLPAHRLMRILVKANCKPTGWAGRTSLWNWDDLQQAANTLLNRDRKFQKKYAKPLAKTSNPA